MDTSSPHIPADAHDASDGNEQHARKRIAVVTMGVKLGDEVRGYTRFRFLSELLAREGFDVDLVTSSFQHWEKAHRDCSRACYQNLPYRVVFIDEPGYRKNLDLARIRSHRVAAKNLRRHFAQNAQAYDLIYAEIPPNDVARTCAEFAASQGIPFVADINDLWPEAMRMVVNVPVISDVAFYPFARDARRVYQLLSGAVGTSDEYAARPAADRAEPYARATVYVGNDLAAFDEGARRRAGEISKPADELWVTYAGTLGASYDVSTLIEASVLVARDVDGVSDGLTTGSSADAATTTGGSSGTGDTGDTSGGSNPLPTSSQPSHTPSGNVSPKSVRVKILGDGPDRERLEALAHQLNAPVDFLGYTPYDLMAAYLKASDITVNSLVKAAAQSIVTKIGDYLASGKPLINTGSSPEFRTKVEADGFGLNVEAEDAAELACAIARLAQGDSTRETMGARARAVAESEFDQRHSYLAIVNLIRNLL